MTVFHCDYDPKCEFEVTASSALVANRILERHIATEHERGK